MMQPDYFAGPLFQVNLMLMLSWRATPGSGIYPIFALAGFEMSFIEQPVNVPPALYARLVSAGIEIQASIDHDVFLEHPSTQTFVPVECKISSFGAASSTARQARAMLVLNGQILSSYIGKPAGEEWDSLLTYITREPHGQMLRNTLDDLSTQIQNLYASRQVCKSVQGCHAPVFVRRIVELSNRSQRQSVQSRFALRHRRE